MSEKSKSKSEAWSSYPETVLIFDGEPEVMIDLRETLSPTIKKALPALGLDGPFAVLTSFNPRGKNVPDKENADRFSKLEAELRSKGVDYLVMDACSPDKSHCERSVALMIDLGEALDIARRWEQVAIFWWDRERFWIHGAISEIEPIALPVS